MGEGPHLNNVINFIIYIALCHKGRPYMFTRSRALYLTSKKLALRFIVHILVVGYCLPPPPPPPPISTKNQGRPGNEAT